MLRLSQTASVEWNITLTVTLTDMISNSLALLNFLYCINSVVSIVQLLIQLVIYNMLDA